MSERVQACFVFCVHNSDGFGTKTVAEMLLLAPSIISKVAWAAVDFAHLQHVQVGLELARHLLEAHEELRLRAKER